MKQDKTVSWGWEVNKEIELEDVVLKGTLSGPYVPCGVCVHTHQHTYVYTSRVVYKYI